MKNHLHTGLWIIGAIVLSLFFNEVLQFTVQSLAPMSFLYSVDTPIYVSDVNTTEKDYVDIEFNRTIRYDGSVGIIRDYLLIREDKPDLTVGFQNIGVVSADTVSYEAAFRTQLPEDYEDWEEGEYYIIFTFDFIYDWGLRRQVSLQSETFTVSH